MSLGLTYHTLQGEEGCGRYGSFGVRIEVAAPLPFLSQRRDPNNETTEEKAVHHAGYEAADLIKKAVMTCVVANDPKAKEQAIAERAQIVGLFPSPIYVEAIPNGYCSDWCCKHLPWFKVTTSVGHFTIGWRKRVISIDWAETKGTKNSTELFAGEDVTKGERSIHAWSTEKAAAYIEAIIGSVVSVSP